MKTQRRGLVLLVTSLAVLLVSLDVTIAFPDVVATYPTAGALVAARAVRAVAAALLAPASLALLLLAFPPERRGAAAGLWGATGGIAAATGPALCGVLVGAARARRPVRIVPALEETR